MMALPIGLPRTVDQWAELLECRFFPLHQRGRHVYFAVDDDVLDELAGGGPTRGAESLLRALRPQLRLHAERELFEDSLQAGLRWSADGFRGPPPILPCLAVCVLAASRMDASEGIASSNYYRRLRLALDLAFSPEAAYRAAVPPMFRLLHEWLQASRGSRGTSTIPDHASPAHVGFALSQALVRESDRRKLTAFFARTGLRPADASASRQLLPALRHWAQQSTLSPGAKRLISDAQFSDQATALLEGELRSWDLSERDDDGRVLGRIDLLLRVAPTLGWGLLATRPPGFPEQDEWACPPQVLALRSTVAGLYDPVILGPQLPSWVVDSRTRPLTFRSGDHALRLAVSSIVPLGPDPNTGYLVSRRRFEPGVRHWLLVHDDLAPEAERLLQVIAREGWQPSALGPRGWHLYRDVFVDLPPTYPVPASLSALIPGVDARPAFRGGLSLGTFGGERWYLVGGEPDIWLPEWLVAASDDVISLDGSPLPATSHVGARISLAGRQLPDGRHVVQAASFALPFRIASGSPDEASWRTRPGVIVLRPPFLLPSAVEDGDAAEPSVCGGIVSYPEVAASKFNAVRLPRGATLYTLIGVEVGRVAACRAPEEPKWMATVGLLPQDFEVFADFAVAWARIEWPFSGSEMWEVLSSSPIDTQDRTTSARSWVQAVLEPASVRDPATAERWAIYGATASDVERTLLDGE